MRLEQRSIGIARLMKLHALQVSWLIRIKSQGCMHPEQHAIQPRALACVRCSVRPMQGTYNPSSDSRVSSYRNVEAAVSSSRSAIAWCNALQYFTCIAWNACTIEAQVLETYPCLPAHTSSSFAQAVPHYWMHAEGTLETWVIATLAAIVPLAQLRGPSLLHLMVALL